MQRLWSHGTAVIYKCMIMIIIIIIIIIVLIIIWSNVGLTCLCSLISFQLCFIVSFWKHFCLFPQSRVHQYFIPTCFQLDTFWHTGLFQCYSVLISIYAKDASVASGIFNWGPTCHAPSKLTIFCRLCWCNMQCITNSIMSFFAF